MSRRSLAPAAAGIEGVGEGYSSYPRQIADPTPVLGLDRLDRQPLALADHQHAGINFAGINL
jgi:hypothetical protein